MNRVSTGSRAARLTALGLSLAIALGGCSDGGTGGGTGSGTALAGPAPATSAAAAVTSAPASTSPATSAVPVTASPTTTSSPVPVARASAGCGQDPAVTATDRTPPGDVPLAIAVGPHQRTYRLGVPSSYDKDTPAPVVLNLHGAGGTAERQSIYTAMPARAAARGFLTVTPDAINGSWELPGEGADDQFLTALLDDVANRYCVDLDRVHAVGLSLGAWKTAITACTHPDRFASIVLVTVEVHPSECGPMPVIAFHGTGDHVVPYGEGADPGVVVTGSNAGLPGVSLNMPGWAKGAGCSDHKDVVRIEPDVDHWIYRDCPTGMGVELYSIVHGDHTWPGSSVPRPGTTQTVDATALALDWFEAHPLATGRAAPPTAANGTSTSTG
jgi:polyhydroxybutyrate depolymerase